MSKSQSNNVLSLNEIGYGSIPNQSSKFPELFLGEKGSFARIRILTQPFPFFETFTEQKTGEVKSKERYGFLVIHKEAVLNSHGQKVLRETIKAFKAGPQIYLQLRQLAMNSRWGDPRDYDVKISRTEEYGNYYTLQPVGEKKTLTEFEQKLWDELTETVETIYGSQSPVGNPAKDDFENLPVE